MSVLSGLLPEKVFYYFEEISKIPRGSYNEKAVSDYCVKFAKDRNLKYYQDELYNVIIIKEASAGRETEDPVIIQGHLDMVMEYDNAEAAGQTSERGIILETDGKYVSAKGSTLGGDDGIAVAFALALLDDDEISHPGLEAVFTVSEEVGMEGASFIDLSMLRGHTVLNMDSEEEGVLIAGCAGGNTTEVSLDIEYETLPVEDGEYETNGTMLDITIDGLSGGHSGTEIDKNRANAIVLMGRLLQLLYMSGVRYDLVDLYGGNKENAIPRSATARLCIYDSENAKDITDTFRHTISMEYGVTDPDIRIIAEPVPADTGAKHNYISEKSLKKIITLINCILGGIQKMSADVNGLVETSLNAGIMQTENGRFSLVYSVRSQIDASKKYLTDRIRLIAAAVGAEVSVKGEYPAWEYKPDSALRQKMTEVYEEMYGEKPVIAVIHAGLECGILTGKIENPDCVSFGPDIYDIHTTRERMSIESVQRVWEYLLKILEKPIA